jgi:hypothetical protein
MLAFTDEALMIAHLLGGANGIDMTQHYDDEEIEHRVNIVFRFGDEIKRRLDARQRLRERIAAKALIKQTTLARQAAHPPREEVSGVPHRAIECTDDDKF